MINIRKAAYVALVPGAAMLLIGATTQVDYPTQVKNGPIFSDANGGTLAQLCAKVGTGTLSITKQWTGVTTQTVSCNLAFNGGSFRPASGQTVTMSVQNAPLSTICDISTSGACIIKSADGAIKPQWWGATCTGDSTHNDAPGIQAAINSITSIPSTSIFNAGILRTSGGCYLGSTVTVTNKSITIRGDGFGSSQNTAPAAGFWKSMAALSGLPMLKITNSQGTTVDSLRFIGSVANPPSAAIVLDQQNGVVNESNIFRNLWIGQWGFDTDAGSQFADCIQFSGINANNGNNVFDTVNLSGCSVAGIDLQHGQYGQNQANNLEVTFSGCGIKSGTTFRATNISFSNNTTDFCGTGGTGGDGNPIFYIDYFASEDSVRLADFSTAGGAQGELNLSHGYYLPQRLPVDGQFVTGITNASLFSWYGVWTDFRIVTAATVTMNASAAKGATTLTTLQGVGGITNGMLITGPCIASGTTVSGGPSGFSVPISTATTCALNQNYVQFYPVGTAITNIDLSHNGTQSTRVLICSACQGITHQNIYWSSLGNSGAQDFNLIDFSGNTLEGAWRALGNTVFTKTNPDPSLFGVNSLSATRLTVIGDQPTITCGAAAGVGCTVSVDATATDQGGMVQLSTDGAPATGGAVWTLTFAKPYTTAPHCTWSLGNANAAFFANQKVYATTTTTAMTMTLVGGSAIQATANYVWPYVCLQ